MDEVNLGSSLASETSNLEFLTHLIPFPGFRGTSCCTQLGFKDTENKLPIYLCVFLCSNRVS